MICPTCGQQVLVQLSNKDRNGVEWKWTGTAWIHPDAA
jgi:hypothetical protein